ncbi:MAG: YdcF family protein [Bacteroides sp.]|nr:YdcF family protein [Bacteroides sp.]
MLCGRIVDDITDFIFVSDDLVKSDIIFLPGGSHPAVPEYGARLYKCGYAPLLMPSGGLSVKFDRWQGVKEKADIYSGDYHTDCEFFTDVLLKNGVPKSAIIEENKSGHTRDNAFLSRKTADEAGLNIKSGIIVCKSFHARRCLMLYQLAFPDAKLAVCPIDVFNITKDNWFTFEQGTDRVLGELARCGGQFAEDIKEYLYVKKEKE